MYGYNAGQPMAIAIYTVLPYCVIFLFCGAKLKFSKEVTHLGHILSENLDDSADIIRETRHLLRKGNYTLCTFSFADPFVHVR